MSVGVEEQAISITLKGSTITLKALLGAVRAFVSSFGHIKHGKQSLRRLNLQNKALESYPLVGEDMKAFKRELNKYSVDFSLYKDKENGKYTAYFKGQDVDRVQQVLKTVLKDYDQTVAHKKPVKDVMDDAVKRAADRAAGKGSQEKEHRAERGGDR